MRRFFDCSSIEFCFAFVFLSIFGSSACGFGGKNLYASSSIDFFIPRSGIMNSYIRIPISGTTKCLAHCAPFILDCMSEIISSGGTLIGYFSTSIVSELNRSSCACCKCSGVSFNLFSALTTGGFQNTFCGVSAVIGEYHDSNRTSLSTTFPPFSAFFTKFFTAFSCIGFIS